MEWCIVAKDGFPHTALQSAPRPAALRIHVGETYDLEVVPRAGTNLTWRYAVNGVPPTVSKPREGVVRVR